MRLSALNPLILSLALGVGASVAGQVVGSKCLPPSADAFRSITEPEMQLLLVDIAKTNPKAIEGLREDPELRKVQLDNLRELLAFASQAVKEGLPARAVECDELNSIQAEVTAVAYDKEKNKNKGPMPPFGFITDAQVSSFWGKGVANRPPAAIVEAREAKFQKFLAAKVALLKEGSPDMKDREITGEESEQARDFIAKIHIYADEYAKSTVLTKAFRDKVALQVKLQQAQFLARRYSDAIAGKTDATNAEIESYIKARPELDPAAKRAKAEEILKRVKAGEDFAKLANEFSDDPGNTADAGKKFGGLYADVPAGKMVEPFEKAAMSLEPGKVHPDLTNTDFGYHIIKLEKKSFGGLTYDVRHILISTGYKDPDDPEAKEVPLAQYVRAKIEDEKRRMLTDRLVAENAISVPDNFDVPATTKPAPAKGDKPRAKSTARKRN